MPTYWWILLACLVVAVGVFFWARNKSVKALGGKPKQQGVTRFRPQ